MDKLSKRHGNEPAEDGWQHVENPPGAEHQLFGGPEVDLGQADVEADPFAKFGKNFEESDEEESDLALQTSDSEASSCEDHEEDERNMDVTGKAISGLVQQAGRDSLRVFRHKVSGIYHLMAGNETNPDVDGEMSSTKCGKLISHNFLEVERGESFLPAKCKRCFTQ